jgi:transposase-like protein
LFSHSLVTFGTTPSILIALEKDILLNKSRRKKGDTGKRYSVAERKKILAFAAKRGRGGITAACRTFGVSYIALRRWMKYGPEGLPRGRGTARTGLDGRKLRRVKTALLNLKSLKRQLGQLQKTLKQLTK